METHSQQSTSRSVDVVNSDDGDDNNKKSKTPRCDSFSLDLSHKQWIHHIRSGDHKREFATGCSDMESLHVSGWS